MCYGSGCKYEQKMGDCGKPFNKPYACPDLQDISRPCDTCRNFYITPDGTRETCNSEGKFMMDKYISERIDYKETECCLFEEI